jgi:crotonobetainyl-CoA:carnitine CoA-transferase CaiB-like acyl-CoA transferase
MMFADYNITWMHTGGKARERVGNFDPAVFPYTYIRCRDGYTFIAAYNDEAFDSLMHIIGRPEVARDPRFSTPKSRVDLENERALLTILEEWSGDRTADEILAAVDEYTSKRGGPAAAVVTGRVNRPLETLSEEHWRERGCFLRGGEPAYGELLLAAPPWKMSGTPARWKSGCRPPGSDNRDVYLGILGMTEAEYRRLAEAGTF